MPVPSYGILAGLVEKMSNPDSDFRFMSLSDLLNMMSSTSQNFAQTDANIMSRLADAVVKALDDPNGEVQNLAVKCLGPLVLKMRDSQIAPLIDRLTTLAMVSQDPSVPSTALRTIISNLPRPHLPPSTSAASFAALQSAQSTSTSSASAKPEASQQAINAAVTAVQRTLIPKMLVLLQPIDSKNKGSGATLDSVDLLVETVRCFGQVLSGAEVERLQVTVMNLLESDRTPAVVKKRGVTALSLLCVYAPDELLSSFINHLVESFRAQSTHTIPSRLRLLISIASSLSKGIPEKFSRYLRILCPFVLSVVNGNDIQGRDLGDEPDMEMDEVREMAFIALENFQHYCTAEMKPFLEDLLKAGSIFLRYDPNYADGEHDEADIDDDEEMGEALPDANDDDGEFAKDSQDEDAFEDDGNFSDEDDISWKVRRCAAKLLSTILTTRAGDLIQGKREGGGQAYRQLAPLLIDRFHEREESVRLEILATTTVLVMKTGEVADGTTRPSFIGSANVSSMAPPPKIRRGSDASMVDTDQIPQDFLTDEEGVKENLLAIVPRLSTSLGKLLKNKFITLPTKQASVMLLSAVISVLHGGLDGSLIIFIGPLVNAAKGGNVLSSGGNIIVASAPGGSTATATGASLRIEVLRLLAKIFENHGLGSVESYLDEVVPAICAAVNEAGYKVAFEALETVIALGRLLTEDGAPPYPGHLEELYDVVVRKVQNTETDTEVREKAIMTLAVLLSRTSGKANMIDRNRRYQSLEVLIERLKNETTRLSAARAIDCLARNIDSPNDVHEQWVQSACAELGSQLRKSNRSLRSASLEALRSIALNTYCRSKMVVECEQELVAVLTPLLVVGDVQLLAVALSVMQLIFVDSGGRITANADVVNSICDLVKSPIGAGLVLENLLALVGTIAKVDTVGKHELMRSLLVQVGVAGDMNVVAKVVAELFVCGGADDGQFKVSVKSFVNEVESTTDNSRKSLALMILGEIGLRQGEKFLVKPQSFLTMFSHKSDDVPLAAALALGLAGSGSVQKFVPVIMRRLSDRKDSYLLVHSLKELIAHAPTDNLAPYTATIWETLISAAGINEDSKAVAAECLGRLIKLDPDSFLLELQKQLSSPHTLVRGMAISALRYTFTDTDTSYDQLLRPIVVGFLESMLQDPVLENRRLALTALNSAATNKAHLLRGEGLEYLLPRVYKESVINPEHVREIQMGPFRHRVDGGLEVRKSAYETLYALLETSFSNIELNIYFDRVIEGLTDEHDIRALANLMLAKLTVMAPKETAKRLDVISETMRKVLSEKTKETAVKQEVERHNEGIRGIVKVASVIQKELAGSLGGGPTSAKWRAFWDWFYVGYQDKLGEVLKDGAV